MILPNDFDLRIDADGLIYSCGFAADSRGGDVSHSIYNLKLVLQMLFTKFGTNYTLWLTNRDASTNFRSHIVTDYKANRVGSAKPKYYKEMRQYLIRHFNAKLTEWGEADDWLGIDYKPNTVICSNDKDLLMIPCYHYRIKKETLIRASDPGEIELITKERVDKKTNKAVKSYTVTGFGFKWFCAQMLLGDRIDNIHKPKNDAIYKSGTKKGQAYKKGMGPKQAFTYLNPHQRVIKQWVAVQKYYTESGYSEDDMVTTAKLLWMARRPHEEFSLNLVTELEDAIIQKGTEEEVQKDDSAA